MITRFTDIINGLQALRKVDKELEKVMKILRFLSKKWEIKVITIQDTLQNFP